MISIACGSKVKGPREGEEEVEKNGRGGLPFFSTPSPPLINGGVKINGGMGIF